MHFYFNTKQGALQGGFMNENNLEERVMEEEYHNYTLKSNWQDYDDYLAEQEDLYGENG